MSRLSVDMAALTRPISDLLPAGESLRRSAVYDRIKEARRHEDPHLSQGVWVTDVKKADWIEVERTCIDILRNKSKDLRVAAWLAEAWLKRFGLEGCVQGIQLVDSLVNRFWDTAYPAIEDDGDLDARMSPIAWINEKLSLELKRIPLTDPQTQEPQILDWVDWEKASLYDRQGGRPKEGEVSTSEFMSCVLLTPAKFYRELDTQLTTLIESVAALEASIDKRCGQPMASLWQFREIATSLRGFVSRALDQKAEEDPDAADAAEAAPGTEEELAVGGSTRHGPIRNRAEAYQRLAEAAQYLLSKEPHSPVPHLIMRAVSWGNMTFAELIQELVQDQRDLGTIYSLLGMQPPR
ncbi:MAG: type VI secretion system protein TssA [bacterium]